MENLRLYLRESYEELVNHVTWPSWNDLVSSARLVIVSAIIIALLIFLFDFLANNALKFVIEL